VPAPHSPQVWGANCCSRVLPIATLLFTTLSISAGAKSAVVAAGQGQKPEPNLVRRLDPRANTEQNHGLKKSPGATAVGSSQVAVVTSRVACARLRMSSPDFYIRIRHPRTQVGRQMWWHLHRNRGSVCCYLRCLLQLFEYCRQHDPIWDSSICVKAAPIALAAAALLGMATTSDPFCCVVQQQVHPPAMRGICV
jgi:hypothetical protein